jgi:hypothetical protein
VEVFGLSIKLKEEGAAAVESSMKKLNAAAIAAGAAIGVTLVAGLKKAVDASVTAQFAQAQLAASIQSTGNAAGQSVAGLNDHAAALQKVSNFGDEAINKAQSLLLTFTKIQGDTFPKATEAVLDVATAMGTDLQSAAIQVGKALNDPILGVTALARSGIQFTQSQKDTIKALVETGQQAEAQRLILKELETQFGGSAKAARETLGGALKGVSNAFGDMFEISKDGSRGLVVALNAVEKSIQTFDKALRAALSYAVPATIAFGSAWAAINFRLIASTVGMLANTLIGLAGTLSLATVKQYALNVAMGANPIGAIIVGLGLLAAGLTIYSDKMDKATEASDKASEANLQYQAALAIRKRRVEEASQADATAALSADQLRGKIAELTRTEKILTAERAKAGNDLVGINVIEQALQRNREALAATTATLARVTQEANEAEQKRVDNLVALTGLTALTREEFRQLLSVESGYEAALSRANLPLADRVELLQKQKAALDALASSTIRGESERMAGIGGQRSRSAGMERKPLDTSGVTELPAIEAKGVTLPTGVSTGLMDSIKRTGQEAREALQKEADAIALQMTDTFAQGIGNGIADGIAAGFERAFATGKIGEGFKALGGTMLAGLGSAMMTFGKAGLQAALLMDGFLKSLSNMLPGGAVAKAVAMIALGGALRGVASAAFGGGGGGGTPVTPTTQFGIPMQGDGTVTRLIFGETSATTAAGMQPRQATNVTIIGPDDPKAQRAIEELITKGQRRGTLG